MPPVYAEPPVNPPARALVANAVSAAGSGVVAATGTPAMMILGWSLAGAALQRLDVEGGGVLRNLGLAVALMLIAVVFAGLALSFTALCRSAMPDPNNRTAVMPRNVPQQPLSVYISLTFLGLAADALALGLLAQGLLGGFRLAASLGTVLEILALLVGSRRHMKAAG
jgi:hypothetical protein